MCISFYSLRTQFCTISLMPNDHNRRRIKCFIKVLCQAVQIIVCLVQLFIARWRVVALCRVVLWGRILGGVPCIHISMELVHLGRAIQSVSLWWYLSGDFWFGGLLRWALVVAWHLKVVLWRQNPWYRVWAWQCIVHAVSRAKSCNQAASLNKNPQYKIFCCPIETITHLHLANLFRKSGV